MKIGGKRGKIGKSGEKYGKIGKKILELEEILGKNFFEQNNYLNKKWEGKARKFRSGDDIFPPIFGKIKSIPDHDPKLCRETLKFRGLFIIHTSVPAFHFRPFRGPATERPGITPAAPRGSFVGPIRSV